MFIKGVERLLALKQLACLFLIVRYTNFIGSTVYGKIYMARSVREAGHRLQSEVVWRKVLLTVI